MSCLPVLLVSVLSVFLLDSLHPPPPPAVSNGGSTPTLGTERTLWYLRWGESLSLAEVELGMLVYVCNPNPWEAEAGGL